MRFQRETLTVEEAVLKLMEHADVLETEEISLSESFGRILAGSVVATEDLPPFDKSPLDGFAVRAIDTEQALPDSPVALRVVETIGAGDVPSVTLSDGEASRIMTGALIPPGADAVVMFEQTVNPGQVAEYVHVKKKMSSLENISRQGEEIKHGEPILIAGEKIGAGAIAALATFGYSRVNVKKKPVVGILCTGNEIVDVDQPLAPGKIRNSNGPMLYAMVMEAGGVPVKYTQLPDDEVSSKQAVDRIIEEVDILITTGGVSVGDFDMMAAIVEHPDVQLLFNRVAIRPGSPTSAAKYKGKMICALSGNPGACFIGFELFVRPLIARMQGQLTVPLNKVEAILTEDYDRPCPYPRYLRGRIHTQEAVLYVTPDLNDKSGNLTTLNQCECFVIIPAGGRGKRAGEHVEIIPIHTPSWKLGGA
ncbi:gephyrin-like molybdotransferase Glp [Brevibacillus ginsengisoli]|uniref:molybdopterin molybdotransferase MoeA n=1 Tax=Brevibacillus ginsengisoli TaxID=363854 RepID=UPI003CEED2E5